VRGAEKTKAKQGIIRLLIPRLESQGFECLGGGRSGGTFLFCDSDGSRLIFYAQVPTFDSVFRLWSYWESSNGDRVATGPYTEPYACPNHPGPKRYTFRFHRDTKSQETCASNIAKWITEALLPWFAKRPKTDWSNPNVIRA